MSRYLLDTNIISNTVKPSPSQSLIDWMSRQADDDLFIASLTVGEIHRGIIDLPPGKKRRALEKWFNGAEGPQILFAGRVLAFDEKASIVWGRLMSKRRIRGGSHSALDMILAATAEANNCVVVTDNEKDFAGIKTINPVRDRGKL